MKKSYLFVYILSFIFITPVYAGAGHTGNSISHSKKPRVMRWYNEHMVMNGALIYVKHCIECHQANAAGMNNWRKVGSDGNYPAPPLNGSGHAWHHDFETLKRTVSEGGVKNGGTMPGFSDKLNSEEINSVLAWVQSNWSEGTYNEWISRN